MEGRSKFSWVVMGDARHSERGFVKLNALEREEKSKDMKGCPLSNGVVI